MAGATAACSTSTRADGYERRQPEQTLLYRLVEQFWPQFRERAEQAGGLPKFVVDERIQHDGVSLFETEPPAPAPGA